MPVVEAIYPFLITSEDSKSGTDAAIYLGIGGREFRLNTEKNDFKRGRSFEGVIGRVDFGRELENSEMNDSRSPVTLRTETLDRDPVYLRIEGNDHWKLWGARVTVFIAGADGELESATAYFADIDNRGGDTFTGGLWLGPKAGRMLYLRRVGSIELFDKFHVGLSRPRSARRG